MSSVTIRHDSDFLYKSEFDHFDKTRVRSLTTCVLFIKLIERNICLQQQASDWAPRTVSNVTTGV